MATLDLRNERGPITSIIFGKNGDCINYDEGREVIEVEDAYTSDKVEIYVEDIPLLILALQKAQELWEV